MKKKIIISTLIIFSALSTIAQQLPLGSCGIVYIHDAAGNRTRRLYYCNNGGPYPTFAPYAKNETPFTKEELANLEFQPVEALYPNPTTGIFYITFSKALGDASISILDINGRTVKQYKSNGIKLTCDLSALAAGTYFVRIEENGQVISKKVIKQ